MTLTISLIDALLALLIVLAIVLLVQLIILIRNLIPSARSMAKIMEDASQCGENRRGRSSSNHFRSGRFPG